MTRILRFVSWLTLRHSPLLLGIILLLTVALYLNIRNLRMGTNVADLFGDSTPELQAVNNYAQHFGYSNQLFVVIEAPKDPEESSERMEALAERLIADMARSGLFKYARCGLKEDEILGMIRLFAWNFPSFVGLEQRERLRTRLSEEQIENTVARAGAGLVTPFSTLGARYFATDPLGLMEFAAPAGAGFASFLNVDLEWGSANNFFSKDHSALLVVAEPRLPVMNYGFAEEVVNWTRARTQELLGDPEFKDASLRTALAGGYVFAEQDRNFIQENIRLVSLASIVGNLILCFLVYRRIPVLLMSFIPTSLGLLWTTGLISYYPGSINLISLSFIAILVGLGDDQVVYFVNRVPQEWTAGKTLDEAIRSTLDTTGRSIIFCILTVGTATLTLALASFKGLAEFGFVLSVGLLMLLVHTLTTIPALMRVWWSFFPPRIDKRATFRFLPAIAGLLAGLVGKHARLILAASAAVFLVAAVKLPSVGLTRKVEIRRADENPAVAGQRLLAGKFGIEGTPELILIHGSHDEVLERTEGVTAALEQLKARGVIRSVFSPTQVVPSRQTQMRRAEALSGIDFGRAADALRHSLKARGFNLAYFEPAISRLREFSGKALQPLSIEDAGAYLPQGLLDNSVRRIGDGRYIAAIAVYSADPEAVETVPQATLDTLRQKFGPFADFSYAKMNRDLQAQILQDSRRALLLTAAGIVLIVFVCFRDLLMTALVLMPIVFSIVVTFGLLAQFGRPLSFMALTALPLVIGIGIDSGIHLASRYLESGQRDMVGLLKVAGAPLIQSNLTTVIGFGALMVSRFEPLAELGLVTAVGVGLTLVAAIWVLPAVVIVFKLRQQPTGGPARGT